MNGRLESDNMSECINRAMLANLGFGDYRRKNWDLGIKPYLEYTVHST